MKKYILVLLLVFSFKSSFSQDWLTNWYSFINSTMINGAPGGGTKLYMGNAMDSLASLINQHGGIKSDTSFVKYNDSGIIYTTQYDFDTALVDIFGKIILRIKYSDSIIIYATKYGQDTTDKNIRLWGLSEFIYFSDTGTFSATRAWVNNMLNTYALTISVGDTASSIRNWDLLTFITFSDTSTFSATRAWVNGKGYGIGSVTSVGTGYGLTGGSITTTGTIVVDTTKIIAFTDTVVNTATKFWVKSLGYLTSAVTSISTSTGILGGTITGTGTLQIDSTKIPKWDDTFNTNQWLVTPFYLLGRGYLTANQTITLSGGVTGSGTTSITATVVTNANLTGPITSTGNATAIASQTGTGTTFVMQTSPSIGTQLTVGTGATTVKFLATTPTTVSGSTSGNATFSEPEGGTMEKRVIIYCAALVGTASYVYPVSFLHTPVVLSSNGLATTIVTSSSTTGCTVTGATTTGFLIIDGF